jgi:hypothetical protein
MVRPRSCSVVASGCEQGKAHYTNASKLSAHGCGVAATVSWL